MLRRAREELPLADLVRARADQLGQSAWVRNATQYELRRDLVRRNDGHMTDAEHPVDDALAEVRLIDVAEVDVLDRLLRDAAFADDALARNRVERRADSHERRDHHDRAPENHRRDDEPDD